MGESEDGPKFQKRAQTLSRTMIPKKYRSPISKYTSKTLEFLHDNWKRVWLVTLWVSINLSLFIWKFSQYKKREAFQVMGYCLCTAKGAAETLKFNMALILIPVCRRTLTKLRSTFLSVIIPFDDNINFHKLIAVAIAIGVFTHTAMHVTCDFPRIVNCSPRKFMRFLGPQFNYKQPSYGDLVESIPGLTGIIMIVMMSFSFTLATHSFRRNVIKLPWPFHHLAGFNAFWYAHHLFVIVYILLIVHGFFLFLSNHWYMKTVCIQLIFAPNPMPLELLQGPCVLILFCCRHGCMSWSLYSSTLVREHLPQFMITITGLALSRSISENFLW